VQEAKRFKKSSEILLSELFVPSKGDIPLPLTALSLSS
jgi:hypothetical protein